MTTTGYQRYKGQVHIKQQLTGILVKTKISAMTFESVLSYNGVDISCRIPQSPSFFVVIRSLDLSRRLIPCLSVFSYVLLCSFATHLRCNKPSSWLLCFSFSAFVITVLINPWPFFLKSLFQYICFYQYLSIYLWFLFDMLAV